MRSECWKKLETRRRRELLGKNMEEEEATDKSVKRFIRKVRDTSTRGGDGWIWGMDNTPQVSNLILHANNLI